MVQELASTRFLMAGAPRSLAAISLAATFIRRLGIVAQERQPFHRHVAAGERPFVVLLRFQRAHQPDDGLAVGENPDAAGAALDLLADALR